MHDLSPYAWRISGNFGIRWYGIAYVLGFIIGWLWLRALARRKLILLKPEDIPDVILAQVIGVMVGGRLGYVFFYDPALLTTFHASFPWWGVLDINNGGMASHGGMVGIILASWWAGRHFKVPPLHVLDCIAGVAPAGVVLGRIANFVNGELLGKIVAGPGEPAPWWSVRFPTELIDRPTDTQLRRFTEVFQVPPGEPLRPYIQQALDQLHAGSADVRAKLEPLLYARHPSQLYQAFAEGIVTLAVVWFIWRKPRRPGVILSALLITYAIGRISTEFIRLPDTQFAVPRPFGLSRGQWFSVVMLVAGIALLGVIMRRPARILVGGWCRRRGVAPEATTPGD
jgi:phosphatidylglycerol:prolipoprotein diacylglycerol transferase